MSNREKLKKLLMDVFLIEEGQFNFNLKRDEVDTWDSLGVVSLATGIQETFGYHLTPREATGLQSVPEIMALLEKKGISFAG